MTDMRLQPALEDPGRVFRDELDSKDNRLWCTPLTSACVCDWSCTEPSEVIAGP